MIEIFRRTVLALFLLSVSVFAAMEEATITVMPGARQEFKGLGVGQLNFFDRTGGFFKLPEKDQEAIYRFIFEELDFKYIRMWILRNDCPPDEARNDYCAQTEGLYAKVVYDYAKKYQPDLVTLFGPWGRAWLDERIGDLQKWAASYAHMMKRFDEMGMHMDYTGIANEPDNHDLLLADQVPELVKHFREELDKRGLQHIKIVAPENTSADGKAIRFVKAVLNDPEALEALDGFATHSYNTSITEEMEETVKDYVLSGEKEYWMTECSDFGPEPFESMWRASAVAARFLADMNHICNIWLFYMHARGMDSKWSSYNGWQSFHMISYRSNELDWRPLLKCYYLKQLSKTFRPGTIMRKAYTDLRQRNPDYYWRAEDSTMVMAGSFGEGQFKAPLFLAAGKYQDTWRVAVTNYTGDVPPEQFAILRPAREYRVNVVIQELADSGDVTFRMFRVNDVRGDESNPYIHDEGLVTMRNGELTIDSLGSFDLVTLQSVGSGAASPQTSIHNSSGAAIARLVSAHGGKTITLEFDNESLVKRTDIRLVDMRGGHVHRALPMSAGDTGAHVALTGPNSLFGPLAQGTYGVILTNGIATQTIRFAVVK